MIVLFCNLITICIYVIKIKKKRNRSAGYQIFRAIQIILQSGTLIAKIKALKKLRAL
jgi:hypothetical protein